MTRVWGQLRFTTNGFALTYFFPAKCRQMRRLRVVIPQRDMKLPDDSSLINKAGIR
jgi:hypothetical protein